MAVSAGLTKLGPPYTSFFYFVFPKASRLTTIQRGGGEKLQQMFLTSVLLSGEAVLRFNQLPAGSQAAVPASPDPGSNPDAKLPGVACGLKTPIAQGHQV